jgi:DNA-binding response OmpR family regulator
VTEGAAKKGRILLVEDEPNLAFTLHYNLQAEGYEVIPAVTGTQALVQYEKSGPFNLIILDVMLPELDGFSVANKIRQTDKRTGILMLTALSDTDSRLQGLRSGVDDYISKPFNLEELLLRISRMIERSALLNQASETNSGIRKFGPFTLDVDSLRLVSPQGNFDITALEADILREFMDNPNRVLSREHLLKNVWGMRGEVETRTVDNFIVRLRRYLETEPNDPKYLRSVRGRGYRLVDHEE